MEMGSIANGPCLAKLKPANRTVAVAACKEKGQGERGKYRTLQERKGRIKRRSKIKKKKKKKKEKSMGKVKEK